MPKKTVILFSRWGNMPNFFSMYPSNSECNFQSVRRDADLFSLWLIYITNFCKSTTINKQSKNWVRFDKMARNFEAKILRNSRTLSLIRHHWSILATSQLAAGPHKKEVHNYLAVEILWRYFANVFLKWLTVL